MRVCAPGLISLAASAALAATMVWPPGRLLVWNASPSSPVGLYLVTPWASTRRGDMVVAWPPVQVRRLAAARHYLPRGIPLVKRVAAIAGDRICASGPRIFVNGRIAGRRRARDRSGRTMPWWSGCRLLRPGQLFLLTPRMSEAFDGRYFGSTRKDEVLGKARLLWPR